MIYSGENVITITPVKNGFIVNLPSKPTNDEKQNFKDMMNIAAQTMKGITEDEILMKAKQQTIEDEEKELDQRDVFMKDENTHIFQSFADVLGFLKITYDND